MNSTAQKTSGRTSNPRKKGHRFNWSATVILVLCSFTVLLPLYVTVTMAFKSTSQAVDGNAFSLPNPISFQGFVEAWQLTGTPVGLAWSAFVTAGTVVFTILLASFAAFAIVRNWEKRFFRYSFFYLLGAMFIPFPVVALPQIQLTAALNLDNRLFRIQGVVGVGASVAG